MMSESDEQRLMHLRKGHDFVREGECNICFLLSVINERDASLAAMTRERDEAIEDRRRHFHAAADLKERLDTAMAVIEAARPLCTNYSPYCEPPAVKKLRDALATFDAITAPAPNQTKTYFDAQPPGDDPKPQ